MANREQRGTGSLYFSDTILNQLNLIPDYPLTVVEAPMGYGKTLAVRQFLASVDAVYVWLNVYDNSTTTFWQGFSRLCQAIRPEITERLLEMGVPANYMQIDQIVEFISDLELTEDAYVVIDDFHHITDPYILRLFERLAESEMVHLHIIITSRFTRMERLEDLKLKCHLHYIDKKFFEFSQADIKAYFRSCGIGLKHEEISHLHRESEGWVSALYLMMMGYEETGSFQKVNSLYKLVDAVLYKSLEPALKDYLLTVCIFDSFTLEQSDFIMQEQTKETIEDLVGRNHFISYNEKNSTYHIHSIFLGFLKSLLKEETDDRVRTLYGQAAAWFSHIHNFRTARRYYFMCKDYDGLLKALEADRSNDYSLENLNLLEVYFEHCPEDVKKRHPFALLIFALHLFLHKRMELFGKVCGQIEADVQGHPDLEEGMRNRLLGELELLLSFAEYNDIRRMVARHKKAWELIGQPSMLFSRQSNWTFGVPSILSLYHSSSGDLSDYIEEMQEGLQYYFMLTDGHGAGAEDVIEAEYNFNKGDFIQAEIAIERAIHKAKTNKEENIYYSARYIKLLTIFMLGKFNDVAVLLDELHTDRLIKEDFHRIHVVEICEGCIYAYLDQMDRIPTRLQNINLDQLSILYPAYPFFNIMYGRILLNEGAYSKVIGLSEQFMSIATISSSVLGHVYTYIYTAAAYRKLFNDEAAKEALIKALELGVADSQYMLFVENCDYIGPVLEVVRSEGNYVDAIDRIFELYEAYKTNKIALVEKYCGKGLDHLTEREQEVALMAASGKRNQDIADELYVSVNTVKKALKSIYTKLEINSRIQLQDKVALK